MIKIIVLILGYALLFMANIQFYQLLRLKLQYVLQDAWPFYVYQSDQRAIEYISLMWTLLSDWHIRFAEGCLWYLKYSLFWCLVGGVSITQCYFTQYLSITTLASTGLFRIFYHLDYFFHMYRIVASRSTSRIVTPHVTNWIWFNL